MVCIHSSPGALAFGAVQLSRKRRGLTSVAFGVAFTAILLVSSSTVLALTFKPPLTKGTAITSGKYGKIGCGHTTLIKADLTTGEAQAESYVYAGNVISPCPPSSINLVAGFASPSFAPTYSGQHKIAFHWTVEWSAWLNSTCGRGGCSYVDGYVALQGVVLDRTTGLKVHALQTLIFLNSSSSGSHLAFGQNRTNYTIFFTTFLNSTHSYELRAFLKEGEYASSPAGGLYCVARVNVATGLNGAWLTSMSAN